MLEAVKIQKGGYGYDKNNPIKTLGAFGSYDYLNSLKSSKGIIVRWKRINSLHSDIFGQMLDLYYVFVLNLDEEPKLFQYQLYFNMYHFDNDLTYPEDFEHK